MESNTLSDTELTARFNGLSNMNKKALRSAALMTAMPEIIGDDIKTHPWKSPLYSCLIPLYFQPVPLLIEGVILYLAKSESEWGARVRQRLKEPFDDAAVACKMSEFIVDIPDTDGEVALDKRALALHILNQYYLNLRSVAKGWQHVATHPAGPTLNKLGGSASGAAKDILHDVQAMPSYLRAAGVFTGRAAQGAWSRVRKNSIYPF